MSLPKEVEDIINETQARLNELADLAASGDISRQEFIQQMRQEIKNAYMQEYLLAKGDAEMSSADWGLLGSLVRDQYNYLDGFAADIANGMSPEAIQARMDMYINSSRSAYEAEIANEAFANGADEEHWICHEDERTCEDCVANDNLGWVPWGDLPFPGDGETACLTHCRCTKEYRSTRESEVG